MLKRSIFGIYHSVSVKHLDRYVGESSYRYNTRKIKDGARFEHSLNRVSGRLTYRNLIAQD
ncbi:transposase [Fibrisoma montanum]|uniref:transposase n=1 Tax=Fibrisoma montanum TaxID=2305895 RepID=UPI0035B57EF2